jgi:hypothetical protein
LAAKSEGIRTIASPSFFAPSTTTSNSLFDPGAAAASHLAAATRPIATPQQIARSVFGKHVTIGRTNDFSANIYPPRLACSEMFSLFMTALNLFYTSDHVKFLDGDILGRSQCS